MSQPGQLQGADSPAITERVGQAREYRDAGLSLVPIVRGSKAPAVPWTDLQARLPTDEELDQWPRQFPGLGIVCGTVSGNLEVIDIESDAPIQEFADLVNKRAPTLLWRLPRVVTPTGGRHVYYRCNTIAGNQKLAADKTGKTWIETRGSGGQVLSPLCLEGTHPSGGIYQLLNGSLTQIPIITPDEREILLSAARSLNEYFQPEKAKGFREAKQGNGTKPGEDYNGRADAVERVRELLRERGWSNFGKSGHGEMWSRPGVTDHSSATLFDTGCLHVFSSNAAPFNANESYSPFAVYAELKHSGDFRLAARDLGALGFGQSSSNGHRAPNDETEEAGPRQAPWPEADMRLLCRGLAGRIVNAILPHTESDPVALLIQILVAFGSVIGRTAHFKAEASRHYLNLFVLLVGMTAKARKGTSWQHIFQFVRRADETWAANCVCTGAPASGEAIVWAVRDAISKSEPIKENGKIIEYRTVITDQGVQDKRALFFMSEYVQILRVMTRDGNTTSAVYRQLWDDDDVMRVVNKNSPVQATGVHGSIIGHITKDEYLRNVSETDQVNGFANRTLHACVKRSKLLPEGGSLCDEDLVDLLRDFRAAMDFARAVGEMRRDADAAALWHEVYPWLSGGRLGMLGALTSRAEAQTMRLACLYALLDCSAVIRRTHLESALALWKYCEDSCGYIFGNAVGDRVADEVLSALHEAADVGLSRSQLRDLFRRNLESDRISKALQCLSENGLAYSRKEPTEGRPVERWFAIEQVAPHSPAHAIPQAGDSDEDDASEREAIRAEGCGELDEIDLGPSCAAL
jgi:hypothetical protein